jgi:hypothetical protein
MVNHLEDVLEMPYTTEGKKDLQNADFYGPLVQRATHSSDKFSMILRNCPKYLEKLHSNLQFLQKKTGLIRFTLGSHGEILLHLAASKSHDEAVEAILQKQ